jgi:abhydrolase domain-containing protein 6
VDDLVSISNKTFETDFINKISSIQTRTLIIWGREDKMIHISGAKFLYKHLKNSQVKIVEKSNHLLIMDQPKQTTRYVYDFMRK